MLGTVTALPPSPLSLSSPPQPAAIAPDASAATRIGANLLEFISTPLVGSRSPLGQPYPGPACSSRVAARADSEGRDTPAHVGAGHRGRPRSVRGRQHAR